MTSSGYNAHLDGHGNLDLIVLGRGAAGNRNAAWTSARIKTRSLFGAPTGGEMMVTASLKQLDSAHSLGYWPGFWMLPPSGWPTTGEIDILADVNGLSKTSGTLHCGNLTNRNPDGGLAEVEVHRTVSTNVLETRTVLTAAAEAGVSQVVCASTGKALRPYSPDMYTASRRAAAWVASEVAAGSEMLISAGRFTHVLNNSIIYKRLLSWADEAEDGIIRLHSPDFSFYVQSALESAQLLLLACLGSRQREFRVLAISDLGWPVSLMDLALDVLSWSLLGGALRAAPRQALMRSAAMARRHGHALGADHRRILEAIEDHADPDPDGAGLPAWSASGVAPLH